MDKSCQASVIIAGSKESVAIEAGTVKLENGLLYMY